MFLRYFAITLVSLYMFTNFVFAQTPACKKLTGDKKKLAEEILGTEHPYNCCDDTFAVCLKQKKVCALAFRLAENICKRVVNGQSKDEIVKWLSLRARSMMSFGKKADISLNEVPIVGCPKALVSVVEYACARCPFCALLTPSLYNEVAKGKLKGKVKFYFKSFPIKGHKYSKEGGLAFVAAGRAQKFWQFMLHFYGNFDKFDVNKLSDWAQASGIDRKTFEDFYKDEKTRTLLIESKKEGLRNKVDATPTLFINGRKYVGQLKLDEIVDVLGEEYEHVKGIEYIK